MRNRKFYIIVRLDEDCGAVWMHHIVYTTNFALIRLYMDQFPEYSFDIYERTGDNIVEVASKFLNETKLPVEPNDDSLEVFSGEGTNINLICSQRQMDDLDSEGMLFNDIETLMTSSVINLSLLSKFLICDHIMLDAYIKILSFYTKRMVAVLECSLTDAPESALKELSLSRADGYYEIFDPTILYVKSLKG